MSVEHGHCTSCWNVHTDHILTSILHVNRIPTDILYRNWKSRVSTSSYYFLDELFLFEILQSVFTILVFFTNICTQFAIIDSMLSLNLYGLNFKVTLNTCISFSVMLFRQMPSRSISQFAMKLHCRHWKLHWSIWQDVYCCLKSIFLTINFMIPCFKCCLCECFPVLLSHWNSSQRI